MCSPTCRSQSIKVYAVGDIANATAPDGSNFPQLGSVALQQGVYVGKTIKAEVKGKKEKSFHYHDKGIMAMIGRRAAVAEVGEHRHELHGSIAFAAWLGVHVALLGGVRHRVDAFVSSAGDYFTKTRGPQVLDRSDAARIDWGHDGDEQGGTRCLTTTTSSSSGPARGAARWLTPSRLLARGSCCSNGATSFRGRWTTGTRSRSS